MECTHSNCSHGSKEPNLLLSVCWSSQLSINACRYSSHNASAWRWLAHTFRHSINTSNRGSAHAASSQSSTEQTLVVRSLVLPASNATTGWSSSRLCSLLLRPHLDRKSIGTETTMKKAEIRGSLSCNLYYKLNKGFTCSLTTKKDFTFNTIIDCMN